MSAQTSTLRDHTATRLGPHSLISGDSPLPAATLDWEALFADRDPLAARQQLAEYVTNLDALGTWAADRAARHDLRPAERSQIYQRS